jgi:putative endonuclease
MRTEGQRAGDTAEQKVAETLRSAGWTILGRAVHVGRAELDIVAVDPGPPPSLVIVEVRFRSSRAFGHPEETVTREKGLRLRRAALALVTEGRLPSGPPVPRLPLRIDLVAVEPEREHGSERRPETRSPGGRGRLAIRHHRGVL